MKIFPLFIPQQGCPQKCIYCNQFLALKEKIHRANTEKALENFSSLNYNLKRQIAFYGGTFTMLKKEERFFFYSLTKKHISPYCSLRISTRPDGISEEILVELLNHNVRTIELGVQSFDNKVLTESKRDYDEETIARSIDLIKEFGFELGIQIMPGLPGENEVSFKKNIEELIRVNPNFVRVYPVIVLKDTELEKLYRKGYYLPLSLDDCIKKCLYILEKMKENNIQIHKIGIHSDISKHPDNVVAGPYHQSFSELVYGEYMAKKIISNYFPKCMFKISTKDISLITGHSKKIIKKIKQRLGVENIFFKRTENMERYCIETLIRTNEEGVFSV